MMKIGFSLDKEGTPDEPMTMQPRQSVPVRSLVQVAFPGRGQPLAYYNSLFDLRPGDIVFVDGKLEGIPGRVVNVSRSFKIRPQDYKTVIARADTEVKGELLMAGSHFIAASRDTIPFAKVLSWYKPPVEDEVITGEEDDGESFGINPVRDIPFSSEIADRGMEYYRENAVLYLEYDGGNVRALVQGTRLYTVEFKYKDGQISSMYCDCFCPGNCKHEFAAVLQFADELQYFESHGEELPEYFASITKAEVLEKLVSGKTEGAICLL